VLRVRIPGKDESHCSLDISFEYIDLRQYVIFHEFANGDAFEEKDYPRRIGREPGSIVPS